MPPKRPPQSKAAAAAKKTKNEAAAGLQIKLVTKLEENDVLMGRGALATDYEGNLRLREIVQTRHSEYAAATKRNHKHGIAEEIVQAVKDRGGRFLQSAETLKGIDASMLPRYEAAWYIVEDEAVLVAKVKQLIRDTKPRNKAADPRPDQETKQQSVLLTHATPAGSTGDHMQPPGMGFLWQQHIQSARYRQQGAPQQATSQSQPSSASAPPTDDTSAKTDGSSVNESQGSSIDQHQALVSASTSLLSQSNATSILQALTAANSPQDQQFDALLALSLASRLTPRHSAAPVAARQPTGPSQAERTQGLELIAATLIAQNQRREREHNLVNTILAQLLPEIVADESPPAAAAPQPPPSVVTTSAPQPSPDPTMAWLYSQLQARSNEASAVPPVIGVTAQAPRSPTLPAAPPPPPSSDFPANLAAFLRGEQTAPRQSGLLEQPNRLIELERLLLSQDSWSRTTTYAPNNSRNPEDGLAQLLRSLQRQYFPSPT
eukprot:scaffold2155_cov162-Amphora_coffeaeformis.AAC.1